MPNFVADFAATPPAADLPRGRPLLLGLGRLHADKGFDIAIRAMPRLQGAVLAIAGEGPELAALQALARREGVADRVHFLGWRHDAGALLRAADVFVCSSRVEPLGNMVIEAWSACCPIAAAAAAGPAELLRDDTDGTLVPLEDPAALAGGIAALVIADLGLKNSPGLELIKDLAAYYPQTRSPGVFHASGIPMGGAGFARRRLGLHHEKRADFPSAGGHPPRV